MKSKSPGNENHSISQDFLHLFSGTAAAIGIPLIELLGKQAEFFIVRRSEPSDIVILALFLTFVPGLLLAGLECLALLLWKPLRPLLHRVFMTTIFILLFLAQTRLLPLGLVLALLLAGVTTWCYHRSEGFYRFMSLAALAVIFLPVRFLYFSPVKNVVHKTINSGIFETQVASKTPIIFIIFDEFPLSTILSPSLEIDEQSFPNFARLQKDSVWYRNAVTVADDTMRAVPAILTGRRAPPDKPPVLLNYPENLFTYLGGTYRLLVSENLTLLSPQVQTENIEELASQRLSTLLSDVAIIFAHSVSPPILETRLPAVNMSWQRFGSGHDRPPRERIHLNFLSSLEGKEPQSLFFLHTNLPHYPYSFLPDGKEYDGGGDAQVEGVLPNWTWRSDWAAVQAYQRHLLQAKFCDRLLGMTIDQLGQSGLYEQCLFVVVSDHGASYHPSAPFRPAALSNLGEVAPVPLLFKLPGNAEAGRIVDQPVTTLDILPTIASILGHPLPWEVQGKPLFPHPKASQDRIVSSDLAGGHRPVPYPESLELLRQAAARRASLFGPNLEKLYHPGPDSNLVRQNVESVKTGPLKAEVLWPSLLLDVNPDSRFVPCRVRGTLADGTPDGQSQKIAVALNDQIVGTGWTKPNGEFSVLFNPDFLKPGENHLDVLTVSPSGEMLKTTLAEPHAYTLLDDVLTLAGRQLQRNDAIQGELSEMILEESGYRLRGWAHIERKPVERIAIFQGEKLVFSGPTDADGLFKASLPKPLISGKQLRVFGIVEDRFAELRYREDYRPDIQLH
ncbi:MAG: sulfatase-like hydrolase/transferase [Vulcanimicrobiota bacterium]